MSSKLGTWFIATLVALSLASCGGEPAGGEVSSASEDSYVDLTDQQGSVDGYVGALEDAQLDRCEATNDGWASAGTVTNPTDSAQSYRLYIAFNKNRDTRGLAQIDLEAVAAGSTEDWQVEAPITGEDLTCVLRVERFIPQD